MTPQWDILIKVLDPEALGGMQYGATTHWPPHYREVTIETNPHWVKKRDGWVKHLIHECYHVLLADLHDHLAESTPKTQQQYMMDLVETAVSTCSNVFYETFMAAHGSVINKLIR